MCVSICWHLRGFQKTGRSKDGTITIGFLCFILNDVLPNTVYFKFGVQLQEKWFQTNITESLLGPILAHIVHLRNNTCIFFFFTISQIQSSFLPVKYNMMCVYLREYHLISTIDVMTSIHQSAMFTGKTRSVWSKAGWYGQNPRSPYRALHNLRTVSVTI